MMCRAAKFVPLPTRTRGTRAWKCLGGEVMACLSERDLKRGAVGYRVLFVLNRTAAEALARLWSVAVPYLPRLYLTTLDQHMLP